jgi:hypothetical protein
MVCGRGVVSRFLRSQPRRIGLGIRSDATPCGQSIVASTLAQRKLERQVVLAVDPGDPALLAGFRDVQLRRPFGHSVAFMIWSRSWL